MEFEPRRAERRAPVVGHRGTDGEAVAPDRRRFVIRPPFEGALEGPHPAHLLLEAHLGVAIRLEDRLGRLAQVVELAQLVGHVGQHQRHRRADRLLAVRDHAGDRHRERLLDLAQQRRQVTLRPAQEAPGEQDLAGHAVP